VSSEICFAKALKSKLEKSISWKRLATLALLQYMRICLSIESSIRLIRSGKDSSGGDASLPVIGEKDETGSSWIRGDN